MTIIRPRPTAAASLVVCWCTAAALAAAGLLFFIVPETYPGIGINQILSQSWALLASVVCTVCTPYFVSIR